MMEDLRSMPDLRDDLPKLLEERFRQDEVIPRGARGDRAGQAAEMKVGSLPAGPEKILARDLRLRGSAQRRPIPRKGDRLFHLPKGPSIPNGKRFNLIFFNGRPILLHKSAPPLDPATGIGEGEEKGEKKTLLRERPRHPGLRPLNESQPRPLPQDRLHRRNIPLSFLPPLLEPGEIKRRRLQQRLANDPAEPLAAGERSGQAGLVQKDQIDFNETALERLAERLGDSSPIRGAGTVEVREHLPRGSIGALQLGDDQPLHLGDNLFKGRGQDRCRTADRLSIGENFFVELRNLQKKGDDPLIEHHSLIQTGGRRSGLPDRPDRIEKIPAEQRRLRRKKESPLGADLPL